MLVFIRSANCFMAESGAGAVAVASSIPGSESVCQSVFDLNVGFVFCIAAPAVVP